MSLLFFGRIQAMGIGTVICALCNGTIIGMYHKILDKYIDFSPAFPGVYRLFGRLKSAEA